MVEVMAWMTMTVRLVAADLVATMKAMIGTMDMDPTLETVISLITVEVLDSMKSLLTSDDSEARVLIHLIRDAFSKNTASSSFELKLLMWASGELPDDHIYF